MIVIIVILIVILLFNIDHLHQLQQLHQLHRYHPPPFPSALSSSTLAYPHPPSTTTLTCHHHHPPSPCVVEEVSISTTNHNHNRNRHQYDTIPKSSVMQPPWLAQQEKAAQIIYRLVRAQLLEIGDIVAYDHLFPWELPRHIQGAKAYFHSTNIPVDQLSPGKDGCVYIEMRTKLGGHSSGVQPLTLTGAIDQKFFKKSPPVTKLLPLYIEYTSYSIYS